MRPDNQLAPVLGLSPAGSTTTEGYFALNPATAFADGFPTTTLPFHGQASNYNAVSGATTLATAVQQRHHRHAVSGGGQVRANGDVGVRSGTKRRLHQTGKSGQRERPRRDATLSDGGHLLQRDRPRQGEHPVCGRADADARPRHQRPAGRRDAAPAFVVLPECKAHADGAHV